MEFCNHCSLAIGKWSYAADKTDDEGPFCCYGCFVGWQAARGGGEDSVAVGFLIRLGVGAFLTMNIMLVSLLLYSGAFDGLHAELKPYAHRLLWVLATPALIILGGPFFKTSAAAIMQRKLVPDMLVVLGTSAAYSYSAIATVAGWDRVYFDTTAMVLILFTLGRYLEANGRARAVRSLRPMLDAEKQQVTQIDNGSACEIPLGDVQPGMIVQVLPGMRIPVDGTVTAGESQAQEATLTGEPHPVDKQPGSTVLAGSINGDQTLLIEADSAGLDSRWIKICSDVRQALSQPSQLQRIAEKTAVVFVPLVLIIAAFTVWLHWQDGQPSSAMLAGLAVLVVACPCALGLAAPLATSVAITRLVEAGILVRNGAALETVASLRTVALDKTGTLTTGQITFVKAVSSDPAIGDDDILRRAAALASFSMHPLSLSVLHTATARKLVYDLIEKPRIVAGKGVVGLRAGDANYLGNERWFREQGIPIVHSIVDAAAEAAEKGHMVTFLAWGGVCRCLLVFDVPSHPQSGRLVSELERRHIDVSVLTGDGKVQARRFCESIGVTSWFAELTPADKQSQLLEWAARRGPVAMVGDGLNDALALTAADIGIAVGNATEVTRETADIVLHTDDITQLLVLLEIAKITKRTIITNLFWAFGYNGVAIALAVSGSLQPVFAALLMAGSSIVVVANTLHNLKADEQHALVPTATLKHRPVSE